LGLRNLPKENSYYLGGEAFWKTTHKIKSCLISRSQSEMKSVKFLLGKEQNCSGRAQEWQNQQPQLHVWGFCIKEHNHNGKYAQFFLVKEFDSWGTDKEKTTTTIKSCFKVLH
jgi:hypothetical protein